MTDPVEALAAAHCPACVGWAPSTSGPVIPCPGFDVVPTGDAGLDAAARGAWQAWDDAMEHADDDGFVDAEWWAPLVGAMDALYARLSSSNTEEVGS